MKGQGQKLNHPIKISLQTTTLTPTCSSQCWSGAHHSLKPILQLNEGEWNCSGFSSCFHWHPFASTNLSKLGTVADYTYTLCIEKKPHRVLTMIIFNGSLILLAIAAKHSLLNTDSIERGC